MKKIISIILALAITAAFTSCEKEPIQSSKADNDSQTQESSTTSESNENSAKATDSSEDAPVQVGDGLYIVSSMPRIVELKKFGYGRATRYEGAKAEAFRHTLDFSALPDEYNNSDIIYCVPSDLSAVYYADYMKFYKSDIDLKNPTLIFQADESNKDIPDYITELMTFDNTKLLFFQGNKGNDNCFGSIDPEAGTADFIKCNQMLSSIPCNEGVLLYETAQPAVSDKIWYWENGKITDITLRDPKEVEVNLYISANGKYICTFLWGKTEENKLVERYSVYDAKSGEFIKSFDWNFNKVVGDNLPMGFYLIDINEDTQSVYLNNTEESKLYQFYFGG